jgi:hypothetical protein
MISYISYQKTHGSLQFLSPKYLATFYTMKEILEMKGIYNKITVLIGTFHNLLDKIDKNLIKNRGSFI